MHKITFSAFFLLAIALPVNSSEKAEPKKVKETKPTMVETAQTVVNIIQYVDYPGQVQIPEEYFSCRTEENKSPNLPEFPSIR